MSRASTSYASARTKTWMAGTSPAMPKSVTRLLPGDRLIDEDLILLRFRPRLVVLVDVGDRALAEQRAGQDQHPDKARRTIGALRENRLGAGFEPGAARSVGRRASVGVDADAAFDQAADAGALMGVQIGAAARRKADAVAPHQEIARRQGVEPHRHFLVRNHTAAPRRAVRP